MEYHNLPYELYHHGILGQKWGIRRYQNPDGTLTEEGKERYYQTGTHGSFEGQSRDSDIRISKGSTAYRVQNSSQLSEGQKYVSLLGSDHAKYIDAAATGAGVALDYNMEDNNGYAYSLKMELSNDMIAPSYQKTMDTFIDTVNQMGGIKNLAADLNYNKEITTKFIDDYSNFSVEECRDAAYLRFCKSFMRDTKSRQIFFDNLKRQGYNALVDDEDVQFNNPNKQYTKAPLIVFDSSNLRNVSVTPLIQEDYSYFELVNHSPELIETVKERKPELYNRWKHLTG